MRALWATGYPLGSLKRRGALIAASLLVNLQLARGLADYYSRNKNKFYPWGFAMNGMTSRLEATRQIIYALGIERIVETGTFRGTTAEWFAQFGITVESVE